MVNRELGKLEVPTWNVSTKKSDGSFCLRKFDSQTRFQINCSRPVSII